MGETKQINIKNRFYYLYRNLIDVKGFDADFLKIDKKAYKSTDIYYIGYSPFIKIGDYWSNFTVSPLYLDIAYASGYIECNSIECNSIECNSIEEKNKNKYLIFDSVDENKEVFKRYEEVWEGIKKEIENINGGEKIEYGKDFLKIKFNSENDLPLNKLLNFRI